MNNKKLSKGTFENIPFSDVKQILENNIHPIHHKAKNIRNVVEKVLEHENLQKISPEIAESLKNFQPYFPDKDTKEAASRYSSTRIPIPESVLPLIENNPDAREAINEFILRNNEYFSVNYSEYNNLQECISLVVPLCQNINDLLKILSFMLITEQFQSVGSWGKIISHFNIKNINALIFVLDHEDLMDSGIIENIELIREMFNVNNVLELENFLLSPLSRHSPEQLYVIFQKSKNKEEFLDFIQDRDRLYKFSPKE